MKTTVKLKCPDCGARLDIDDNLETAFCMYCGAKVLVHDGNQSTYRNVNESKERVRKAEIAANDKHSKRTYIILAGVAVFLVIIMGFVFFTMQKEHTDSIINESISVTLSSKDFKKMDYRDAKDKLKSLGFSNIHCIPEYDLTLGIFKHAGQVDTISINGEESFEAEATFPKNASVDIFYHELKYKNTDDNEGE